MARTITGTVASDKGDKTIVISVHTRKTHPIYKKQYTVTTKFMAHDENNDAKLGDKVIIVETRPLSKRKRFTLKSVVEKARFLHVEPEATAEKSTKPAGSEEAKPAPKARAKKESK